tara:strand:- start:247 stop:1563 length:1317 start_codon:yes stop_codon:yes gene_type:complete
MKKIYGLQSSIDYISDQITKNEKEFFSDGGGLFKNKLTPSIFARNIISIVKEQGDQGLRHINKFIEKTEIESFRVSKKDSQKALDNLNPEIRSALEISIKRIYDFQTKTLPKSWVDKTGEIGENVIPIDSIGAYIPGGTAPLLSTVIMTLIPAKVAGVKRTVLFTPYTEKPSKNPIIACAELIGVSEIYNIGGAQAIAAMAYGTESIRSVDFICGPGNIWVTAAKKEVFGKVGIDGIYGPTETMVIVDESSNHNLAASDLLAQSEHDTAATPMLISIGNAPGDKIIEVLYQQLETIPRKNIAGLSIRNHGVCFFVKSENEAIEIANTVAPEHLSINIKNPKFIAQKCNKVGALFIGENSAEVMADYLAGPSHVMPTGGTAKFSSALSTRNFVTITPFLNLNKKTFQSLAENAILIAKTEKLLAHAFSAKKRLEEFKDE